MNDHNYLRRIAPVGIDLWQCQAPDCQEQGTLAEMANKPCKHIRQPGEMEQNLLDAVKGRKKL